MWLRVARWGSRQRLKVGSPRASGFLRRFSASGTYFRVCSREKAKGGQSALLKFPAQIFQFRDIFQSRIARTG